MPLYKDFLLFGYKPNRTEILLFHVFTGIFHKFIENFHSTKEFEFLSFCVV